MAISDEELVERLESMPMVEAPDFRPAVLANIRGAVAFRPPSGRLKPAAPRFALGLAWAAAVAIVIGIAFIRPPSRSGSSATIASYVTVTHDADRVLVKPNVNGTLEFDQTKLTKIGTLPDGTVVLKAKPGATGAAG